MRPVKDSIDLDVSPGGTASTVVSNPVCARPCSSAAPCSASTVVSVITTARFCGNTGASSAPARASNPSPVTTSYDVLASRTCRRRAGRHWLTDSLTRRVVCSGVSSAQSTMTSASA